jgi:hypothetical protein
MDMARYYELMADALATPPDDDAGEVLSPEEIDALRDGLEDLSRRLGRISISILFTERGIEMPSVVTLADP